MGVVKTIRSCIFLVQWIPLLPGCKSSTRWRTCLETLRKRSTALLVANNPGYLYSYSFDAISWQTRQYGFRFGASQLLTCLFILSIVCASHLLSYRV